MRDQLCPFFHGSDRHSWPRVLKPVTAHPVSRGMEEEFSGLFFTWSIKKKVLTSPTLISLESNKKIGSMENVQTSLPPACTE